MRNRRDLSALADPLHLADRNSELSASSLFRLYPPGLAQLSNVVGGNSQLFGHLAYSEVAFHRYHLSWAVLALPPRGTLRSCFIGIELASLPRSIIGSAAVLALGPPAAFGFLFAFWTLGRGIAIGLGQRDEGQPVSSCGLKDELAI